MSMTSGNMSSLPHPIRSSVNFHFSFNFVFYRVYLADTWLNYAENEMKIRKKIMVKIMIMAILKIRKIIKPQLLSQG